MDEQTRPNSSMLLGKSESATKRMRMGSAMPGAAQSLPKQKAKASLDGIATGMAGTAEKKDAGALEKKTVAGRTFTLRDGVWQQDGYTKGARAKTLRRDSRTLEAFLKKHPEVKPILEIGNRVVFQCEDHWYRVEPKSQ